MRCTKVSSRRVRYKRSRGVYKIVKGEDNDEKNDDIIVIIMIIV